MRAVAVLPVLALAALWAQAVVLWPEVPERFPIHFGLDGRPDRWADRSALLWFLLPALATLLGVAVAYALPVLLRRLASSASPALNVPRRAEFARLPVAARLRALEPGLAVLRLVGLELVVTFALIHRDTARVALGEVERLSGAAAWVPLVVLLVTALAIAPLTSRAVGRELASGARESTPGRESGSPGPGQDPG